MAGGNVQQYSASGSVSAPRTTPFNTLSLSDLFAVGDWKESQFDVADRFVDPARRSEVRGLGVLIPSCGASYIKTLELRLPNRVSRLTMNVGQANSSPSISETLIVEVVANGRQVDLGRVPFGTIKSFDVDIGGVNALKLNFSLDQKGCQEPGGAIIVVEALTVTG